MSTALRLIKKTFCSIFLYFCRRCLQSQISCLRRRCHQHGYELVNSGGREDQQICGMRKALCRCQRDYIVYSATCCKLPLKMRRSYLINRLRRSNKWDSSYMKIARLLILSMQCRLVIIFFLRTDRSRAASDIVTDVGWGKVW